MKASGNIQLKLMDIPTISRVVEVAPNCRCGYCGGVEPSNGKRVVIVNGVRIHPNHKACIKSAKFPLFDMAENNFRRKSG